LVSTTYDATQFGWRLAPPARVHIILTSLSNLPETTGLFLIGLVLIVSGIVLRRVFLTLDGAVPAPGQNAESKEHPLK
jgi:hypothetical protein